MDFDTVADELYALPPEEFTARRDTAAALARRQGDRALAARVHGLRRPTRGAWLANLLVRSHPEQIGPLLELGEALRAAQRDQAGARLRELSTRRHHLVTALTERARRTAAEAGHAPGEPALRDLEQTLRAVLADRDAAGAFAAGRLATALDTTAPLPEPGASDGPSVVAGRKAADGKAADRRAVDRRAAEREAARAAEREAADHEAAQAADARELRAAEHRRAVEQVRRSARRLALAERAHREAEREEAERADALADAERQATRARTEADRLRRQA
ncbi:hypothetical protein [Kitasatospora sp. NPDC088346]|uniref:hypothetical protein n=1 Tax=Kitasatospora sp. NPDC088346 TaxID=3364073 RepID=UPI00380654AA